MIQEPEEFVPLYERKVVIDFEVTIPGFCDHCGQHHFVMLGNDKWLCPGCIVQAMAIGNWP